MDLQAYLDRIGFEGAPRADLDTLRGVHRAHLLAIPYENLDVQLGRAVSRDPEAAFEKLVIRRRGGWCYEMNGLLGAALEAIGFSVTRMAGGVHRMVRGDEAVGNHLVLRVDLDEGPWIADAGFGDGPLDPYPLREGAFESAGFPFRLENLEGRWWRLHNHPLGGAATFDFEDVPADAGRLEARCQWLQSAPESNFVLNAVAQRHVPGAVLQLRGRTLRRVVGERFEDRLIGSADEYLDVLATEFDLDLPEAATLWPRICARHAELFGEPA